MPFAAGICFLVRYKTIKMISTQENNVRLELGDQ